MARYARRGTARRSTRSRSSYSARPRARRAASASRGRRSSGGTMRLVIEHVTNPGPTAATLPIGLKVAPAAKKAKF